MKLRFRRRKFARGMKQAAKAVSIKRKTSNKWWGITSVTGILGTVLGTLALTTNRRDRRRLLIKGATKFERVIEKGIDKLPEDLRREHPQIEREGKELMEGVERFLSNLEQVDATTGRRSAPFRSTS